MNNDRSKNLFKRLLTSSVSALLLLPLTLLILSVPANAIELNGMAMHSELRQDYYIGALYMEAPNNTADGVLSSTQNKRIVLRVLAKRWSARAFNQHWTQSILINAGSDDLEEFANTILAFTSAIKGRLVIGDELIIDSPKNQPLRFSVNGIELMLVEKHANHFFNLILASWVGARPPSSKFKRDILGNSLNTAQFSNMFEALKPAAGREEIVSRWINTEDPKPVTVKVARAPKAVIKPKPKPKPKQPKQKKISIPKPAVAPTAPVTIAAAAPIPLPTTIKPTPPPTTTSTIQQAILAPEAVTTEQPSDTPAAITSGSLLVYQSAIIKKIYSKVIYPRRAIDRGNQGTVHLSITLTRSGQLAEASIDKTSGFKRLNDAALKAAKKAAPYPAPPSQLATDTLDIHIPIHFKLE